MRLTTARSPGAIAGDLPATARRLPVVLATGVAVLAVGVVLALGVGTDPIGPGDVIRALAGDPARAYQEHIVIGLRLPRALITLTAGGMLALAGALLQSGARNPLAEPSMLGVTGGAVLAVVAVLTVTSKHSLPGLLGAGTALIGALCGGGAVYLLGWHRRSTTERLLLDGVLVSAILSALTSVLLLLDGALFGTVLRWVVGSLNGRVWSDWALLWPSAALAIPAGLLCTRSAAALFAGDEVAASIGLPVPRARAGLFLAATALTASAVTAVGAIGFIGLIAPHLARLLVGSHPARVLPLSVLLGAALLLGADLLAVSTTWLVPAGDVQNRTALPTGAVTALIGGPVLLWLLTRGRR